MPRGTVNLDRQGTNWQDIAQGGPAIDLQLSAYTGTWTITGAPAANIEAFKKTEGINGAIMIELVENNVGAATINIEGSFDAAHWYAAGYQRVDATTNPARTVATTALTQNTRQVLQVLDSYPLTRVRPSVNTGSVSAGFYCVPA